MDEKTQAQMRAELREFYFNKVKPNLEKINKSRRSNSINVYAILSFLTGFALICLLGNIKVSGHDYAIIGLPFIIIGVLILIINNKGNSKRIDLSGEEDVKRKYMPEFLKIFGSQISWSKDNVYKAANDLNIYKTLNIMNPYFILTFDDTICGTFKDVKFNILEVDTSITSVKNFVLFILMAPFAAGCGCFLFCLGLMFVFPLAINLGNLFDNDFLTFCILLLYVLGVPLFGLFKLVTKVPFQGVLVEFEMNKNFEGHTFVLERASTNCGITFDRTKFQEVKLEDPEFTEKYVVYSNNQVEARYVLTTAFIERFLNMKVAFKAKYIRAAFKDGKITIAIDAGRDLFRMATLGKDTDSNTFTELFDEILSVLELINALKLNQKIGL